MTPEAFEELRMWQVQHTSNECKKFAVEAGLSPSDGQNLEKCIRGLMLRPADVPIHDLLALAERLLFDGLKKFQEAA